MQTTDILDLVLASAGNRFLRHAFEKECDALGEPMGMALDHDRPERSPVVFKVHENFIFWETWRNEQVRMGALSFGLATLTQLSRPSGMPDASEIPESAYRAFQGSTEILMTVSFANHTEAWAPQTRSPRQTDLTVQDIRTFLCESQAADRLKAMMLWENAHNLHFYESPNWLSALGQLQKAEGDDAPENFVALLGHWDAFAQSISYERVERFVKTFGSCCYNGRTHKAEGERWSTLYNTHRVETPVRYEYRKIGSFARISSMPIDLSAQSSRLTQCLKEISVFASKNNLPEWADFFTRAIALLSGPIPEKPEFLIQPLRVLHAKPALIQTLAAAVDASHAFGGMGTWSDVGLTGGDYERLSMQLLQAIDQTVLVASQVLQEE